MTEKERIMRDLLRWRENLQKTIESIDKEIALLKPSLINFLIEYDSDCLKLTRNEVLSKDTALFWKTEHYPVYSKCRRYEYLQRFNLEYLKKRYKDLYDKEKNKYEFDVILKNK